MSGSASAGRGMPLLSGPPPEFPDRVDVSCRRCNREFNVLFNRKTTCNHCGFVYCHSCASFHALMPRPGTQSGYVPAPVCSFCMPLLQITAGGKAFLRSLPLKRLKNYMQVYRIFVGRDILEKDDIIEAIVATRGPNGCLPPAHENFYRKNSVPNAQTSNPRTFFSRSHTGARVATEANIPSQWSQAHGFPRPDLEQDHTSSSQDGSSTRPEAQSRARSSTAYSSYSYSDHVRQSARFERDDYESNDPQFSDFSSAGYQRQSRPYQGPSYDSTYDTRMYGGRPTNTQQTPSPGRGVPPQSRNLSPNHTSDNPRSPGSNQQSRTRAAPNFSRQHSSTSNLSEPESDFLRPSRGNDTTHSRDGNPALGTRLPTPEQSLNSSQRSTQVEPSQRTANPPAHLQAPSLDDLLTMQDEAISHLSVSALKAILFDNHVNARNILEKSELIARIHQLVATERQERAHMDHVHEMEELEERMREEERQRGEERGRNRRERYRTTVEEIDDVDSSLPSSSSDPPTPSESLDVTQSSDTQAKQDKPKPSTSLSMERSGVCVVCQDEDANIVIIDCGHLALCRACSDLVMTTTRECPLCRTRIITEARLLRVFKT